MNNENNTVAPATQNTASLGGYTQKRVFKRTDNLKNTGATTPETATKSRFKRQNAL